MSERQESPYDVTARRWLALVERRQENIIELCTTGRWRRYYTHPQFLEEMHKVLDLRNRWARLAGLPVSEQIDVQLDSKQNRPQSASKQNHPKLDSKQNHPQSEGAGQQHVTFSRDSAEPRRKPASTILAAVAGRL
jgi:uncharacterized repeat protein (TIGR03809 family)